MVKRTIESTFEIEVTREDILALVREQDPNIPDTAEVYVDVPGGGDWSHCDLDIRDQPIKIRWKSYEESTDW